ncbi:MAG: response regulator [Phycisphaerales bacterium]|nr:MAG: response regulator [Phycisphaerales bacterium]
MADPNNANPNAAASAPVLIVDDNEQNLELLEAYLEDLGVPIVTATDGQQALDLAAKHKPAVVLLDVMMPRMSGFQACERLKKNEATRDVPVILVTALNEVADQERGVEAGADDFLTKPVNRLELLTRVRSLMKVSRLQTDLDAAQDEVRRLRDE